MGLSSIAGYSNVGSVAGVSHSSSRYSTPSAQVAQAAQAAVSAYALSNASFPISPDVKLKNLPFYDVLGELLKPSTLGK